MKPRWPWALRLAPLAAILVYVLVIVLGTLRVRRQH